MCVAGDYVPITGLTNKRHIRMLVINKQYEYLAGKVGRVGPYSVQTLFYQFLGLPIWPQESYFIKGGGLLNTPESATEIARDRKSVMAAYLTLWPLVGGFYTAVISIAVFFAGANKRLYKKDPMILGVATQFWAAFGIAAVLIALGVILLFALKGAVTEEELAKRAIYQKCLGFPVDPSALQDSWSDRDDLKRAMAEMLEASGLPEYKKRAFDKWKQAALDPRVTNQDFLFFALTTSRLIHRSEEKRARQQALLNTAKKYEDPEDRDDDDDSDIKPNEDETISSKDAEALHAQIWSKIVQLNPQVRALRPS